MHRAREPRLRLTLWPVIGSRRRLAVAMIPVFENYKDYEPPRGVRAAVERLLGSLPPGYLSGLESLVLTNSAAIGKGKTKRVRGRKYKVNECRGFYYPASATAGPWIAINVDRILPLELSLLLRWGFFVELLLSGTVFHEVGHHLDATIGSPSRSGERAANRWSVILRRECFRKQHPILTPIVRGLAKLSAPLVRRKIADIKAEQSGQPN